MPELAWNIGQVEAQAKRWKEMTSVLSNDEERVAWLIDQISFLSASHMQLQQVCKAHLCRWHGYCRRQPDRY